MTWALPAPTGCSLAHCYVRMRPKTTNPGDVAPDDLVGDTQRPIPCGPLLPTHSSLVSRVTGPGN